MTETRKLSLVDDQQLKAKCQQAQNLSAGDPFVCLASLTQTDLSTLIQKARVSTSAQYNTCVGSAIAYNLKNRQTQAVDIIVKVDGRDDLSAAIRNEFQIGVLNRDRATALKQLVARGQVTGYTVCVGWLTVDGSDFNESREYPVVVFLAKPGWIATIKSAFRKTN